MAVGPDIETRVHRQGFRVEIAKAAADRDRFFTWFNGGQTAEEAMQRGRRDFDQQIWRWLKPEVADPRQKSILEIGHGGGRLLAAAARYFDRVVGVDIHACNDLVRAELRAWRIDRCELYQVDDPILPLADDSIDVAYSFIVLQHVERIEVFESYLHETFRVLKPGGAALLYFGRKTFFSANTTVRWLCTVDRWLERIGMPRYQELPARVNCVNLFVSRRYACNLARRMGYVVQGSYYSTEQLSNGKIRFKGQIGILLRKPRTTTRWAA